MSPLRRHDPRFPALSPSLFLSLSVYLLLFALPSAPFHPCYSFSSCRPEPCVDKLRFYYVACYEYSQQSDGSGGGSWRIFSFFVLLFSILSGFGRKNGRFVQRTQCFHLKRGWDFCGGRLGSSHVVPCFRSLPMLDRASLFGTCSWFLTGFCGASNTRWTSIDFRVGRAVYEQQQSPSTARVLDFGED